MRGETTALGTGVGLGVGVGVGGFGVAVPVGVGVIVGVQVGSSAITTAGAAVGTRADGAGAAFIGVELGGGGGTEPEFHDISSKTVIATITTREIPIREPTAIATHFLPPRVEGVWWAADCSGGRG